VAPALRLLIADDIHPALGEIHHNRVTDQERVKKSRTARNSRKETRWARNESFRASPGRSHGRGTGK
jgi:hypothetical protein